MQTPLSSPASGEPSPERQTPITTGFENQWDLCPESCKKMKLHSKGHMQKLSCSKSHCRGSALKNTWVIRKGDSLTDFMVCAGESGIFCNFLWLCSHWATPGFFVHLLHLAGTVLVGTIYDSPHLTPGSPVDPPQLTLLQSNSIRYHTQQVASASTRAQSIPPSCHSQQAPSAGTGAPPKAAPTLGDGPAHQSTCKSQLGIIASCARGQPCTLAHPQPSWPSHNRRVHAALCYWAS